MILLSSVSRRGGQALHVSARRVFHELRDLKSASLHEHPFRHSSYQRARFTRSGNTRESGWWSFRSPPPPRFGGKRIYAKAAGGAVALTPAAFVAIGEEDRDDNRTGEDYMLEASRKEIEEYVPQWLENSHGFRISIYNFLDNYIIEPVATGFRFLHLVVIFVPVILTVPIIFMGKRNAKRDNERSGTLWWYAFLVKGMERAGAAFIKVGTLLFPLIFAC